MISSGVKARQSCFILRIMHAKFGQVSIWFGVFDDMEKTEVAVKRFRGIVQFIGVS